MNPIDNLLRNYSSNSWPSSRLLRHGADFGLFLGFAAEAFGEEFVEQRLFQFGGQRDQPLLLLDRPLHQPQHRRNLSLLANGGTETSKWIQRPDEMFGLPTDSRLRSYNLTKIQSQECQERG